jgi:hypothetical protein
MQVDLPQTEPSRVSPLGSLAIGAVAGSLLLSASYAIVRAIQEIETPEENLTAGLAMTVRYGAVAGVYVATAGLLFRRFAVSLAGGAVLSVTTFQLTVALHGPAPWWRPGGLALPMAVACFGAICAGTTAVVSRSPKWTEVRFSLRELIALTAIWCMYFASLSQLSPSGK